MNWYSLKYKIIPIFGMLKHIYLLLNCARRRGVLMSFAVCSSSLFWSYYKTRNTGTQNDGIRNTRGTTEHHRNTGTRNTHWTTEQHLNTEQWKTGTRNTRWTTEQRRNNGTPPEQRNTPRTMETPRNGTAEHYDRALTEERNFETTPMKVDEIIMFIYSRLKVYKFIK